MSNMPISDFKMEVGQSAMRASPGSESILMPDLIFEMEKAKNPTSPSGYEAKRPRTCPSSTLDYSRSTGKLITTPPMTSLSL